VAALVLLLVVAIAKPWAPAPPESSAIPPHPTPAGVARAAATPAATRAPTPDTAAEYCLSQTSWMVTGIMVWGSRTVRTWEAIRAVKAAGPLDSAIEFGLIVSPSVWAVGYCAPVSAASPKGQAVVSAWLIAPDGAANPIALRPWRPEVPPSSLGELYVEAADQNGSGWSDGRFVFAIDDTAGGSADWFGVDVVDFVGTAYRPSRR
jgi:hypothetical protein